MLVKRRKSHLNYLKIFSCGFCVLLTLWVIPFIFKQYADISFPYIQKEEILKELVGKIGPPPDKLFWCPPLSPYTHGASVNIYEDIHKEDTSNEVTFVNKNNIQSGGTWQPTLCSSRFEVVIIVPYRNRPEHLRTFLLYMHPFLQRQLLNYRILVVEQNDNLPFNRARLFNIGYKESKKFSSSNRCLIFHDVDLIPINDLNTYACTHHPRHMYSALDTFRYHLPYRDLFGGAIAILSPHFEEVNGFSNSFYGWGGEDDDFSMRLKKKNLHFIRFDPLIASYIMMSHVKEVPSPKRWDLLKQSIYTMDEDGLSSLSYFVDRVEFLPLYTRILVT